MSLHGQNAHWQTPRVIKHEGFNRSYSYVFFQPDGTILKCLRWVGDDNYEDMEPDDQVLGMIESARNACILGLDINLKGEKTDHYSSPYLVKHEAIKDDITLLKRAYFSEHGTDDCGLSEKVWQEFPVRPEDEKFVEQLINKAYAFKRLVADKTSSESPA